MKKQNIEMIARGLVVYGNEILLVRRSQSGSRPGDWEIPGGKVELGENLEDAAIREVFEETGIKPVKTSYISSDDYTFEGENRMGVLFLMQAQGDRVKLSSEHDQHVWVNKDNFHNVALNEYYTSLLQNYFKTTVNKHKLETNDVKKTSKKVSKLRIHTDGGSRGNPGPSASGYVIMDEHKNVIEEGGEYLGITTNNQAEYQAVKLALENAKKFHPDEVDMYIDSLLVVNQIKGIFKVKNRDLWPIHEAIKELMTQFDRVHFTHVKREFNSLADAQVNAVLDAQE